MTSRDYNMLASNTKEVRESPISLLPGEEPVFTVTIEGTGTISGTPTMELYKGSTDDSSNLTGSVSVSDRAITCKKITNLVGGADYVFYITFVDDLVTTVRFCRLHVLKKGIY